MPDSGSPGLSINFTSKMQLVEELADCLDKMGKRIKVRRQSSRRCFMPFILKGVLSLQDTRKAIEAGVQGIVVSHHHGIQGYAIPPLMILPRIVEMINGCMPIFVDCGMNTGSDVFKALALGATAVSVGRELMGPLSKEGPDGVQKTIEKITADLAAAMARTGSPDPAHIDPSVIWKQ